MKKLIILFLFPLYLYSCSDLYWDNTSILMEKYREAQDLAYDKIDEVCASSFNNGTVTKSNYQEYIYWANKQIKRAKKIQKRTKKLSRLGEQLANRWYQLHESCDDENSDRAYENYTIVKEDIYNFRNAQNKYVRECIDIKRKRIKDTKEYFRGR